MKNKFIFYFIIFIQNFSYHLYTAIKININLFASIKNNIYLPNNFF